MNPQTKALPQPGTDKLNEAALDLYRALEELVDYAHMQLDKIPEQATWRIDDRALSRADTALAKARSQTKPEPKYDPQYSPAGAATGATGAYGETGGAGQHLRSPEDKQSTELGGNKTFPPRPDDTSGSDARNPAGTATGKPSETLGGKTP